MTRIGSLFSGSGRPIATWNPQLKLWECSPSSGDSVPYSETWPTSGMTRSGKSYPRAESARLIEGSGSLLLPTPTASDCIGGQDSKSRPGAGSKDLTTVIIEIELEDGPALRTAIAELGVLDAISEGRSSQVLQGMRDTARSETIPQRTTRGSDPLLEAGALLPGMCQFEGGGPARQPSLARTSTGDEEVLSEMRGYNRPACPPQGPESNQQSPGEPGGALRKLPPEAALDRRSGDAAGCSWRKYAPAIARWERVTGRPAPDPAKPSRNGRPRPNPEFFSWMMGWPEGWVTGSGVSRADQLWIIGNGCVSQQVLAALDALEVRVP